MSWLGLRARGDFAGEETECEEVLKWDTGWGCWKPLGRAVWLESREGAEELVC